MIKTDCNTTKKEINFNTVRLLNRIIKVIYWYKHNWADWDYWIKEKEYTYFTSDTINLEHN